MEFYCNFQKLGNKSKQNLKTKEVQREQIRLEIASLPYNNIDSPNLNPRMLELDSKQL